MRYFATAIPGIAPVLGEELASLGFQVTGEANDGRNDLVEFEAHGYDDARSLHTAEDVYVEVAGSRRAGGVDALVRRLLPVPELNRALSVYAAQVRPLGGGMSFRVIARVLSERQFRRTELRDNLTAAVIAQRPRWRFADPAQIELWALEGPTDRFRLGLRLTTGELRHRGGREEERSGALRPTVAAAMVLLAGGPNGRLLDPFCGSGTIVREAISLGWEAAGSDLGPDAVAAAERNLAGAATVSRADARALPLLDGAAGAVVSNLPFGVKHVLPDDPAEWFRDVLAEIARVTRDSAPVVLLMPPGKAFERALRAEKALVETRRLPLELLGRPTAIWRLERATR